MSISISQAILVLICSILVVGLDTQGPLTVTENKESRPTVAGSTDDIRIWTENTEGRDEKKAHGQHEENSLDKTQISLRDLENENRGEKSSENVIVINNIGTDKFHVDKSERSDVQSGVQSPTSSVINDNSRSMAPPAETRDHAEDTVVQSEEERTFPSKLSDLSSSERKKVLNSLEASFLNVVGLNSRPNPDKSISIPQYMLELYQKHIQSHEGRKTRSKYHKGLHNSNTIRSFFIKDEDEQLPENVARLQFNVTSLPGHEDMKAAELRLYRKASTLENQHHLSNVSAGKLQDMLNSKHRIDIYQIILPPRRSAGREAITRLLDTRVVDPAKTSWEIFDVTPAVDAWRTDSKNYGLEVRISKESGENSPLKHVRLKRSTTSERDQNQNMDGSLRNWNSQEPLLVTYSDDRAGASTQTHRSKRETTRRRNRDTRKKRNSKNKERRKKRKDRPRKDRDYKKNCRRRPLYVDFHDVGWTDWIVAPPGYEAHYCYGECPFHLAEHFNTTNHAVVQQFVHSVDPAAVPKACCVPTELSEVALLYIDEENNVVLRRYEEMVVEACGCR